ncbi:MAG: cytochrome C oxidase subunit IV family protein [Candidatus Zixiibacteriota bacterium]
MNKEVNHNNHVIGLGIYINVGLALLALTAITVAISFVHLGPWNVAVALFIAAFKATLVVMFFMHLYYDKKLYLIILLVAVLFLAIFIGFTMFDTLRRGDIDAEVQNPINSNAIIYKKQLDSLSDSTLNISDTLSIVSDSSK